MKNCKYKYHDLCCNDSTPFLADYPSEEDCAYCDYYEELKIESRESRDSQ